MSTTKLLVALFYFKIIFCSGFQTETLYRNDAGNNNYICKDDVFRLPSTGVIECAFTCKSNATCLSFFYNDFNGECTGCMAVYTQDDRSHLRTQTRTTYYHEILPRQQITIHATTTLLTIETTSLLIETLWDPNNIPNYIVNTIAMTYRDAMKNCELSKGAQLAFVNSPDENAHLTQILMDRGVIAAFIGGVVWEGKLMDGFDSSIESPYTNNIDVDQAPDEGSCITLLAATGDWNLVNCQSQFPSICESAH